MVKSCICTPAGNKWGSLSIACLRTEACRPCNQTPRPYSKTIGSDDSLLWKESVSVRMLANNTKWKTGSLHNFYSMSHNFGDDSSALTQIGKNTCGLMARSFTQGWQWGHPLQADSSVRQEHCPVLAPPIQEPVQWPPPPNPQWQPGDWVKPKVHTAARANGSPLILVLKLGFIILQDDCRDPCESILYF